MLLIFGSSSDDQPRQLAERLVCRHVPAKVVTPADLSKPGWRLRVGRSRELQARAGDRIVRGNEIVGVVNMLPWITVYDLPHIAAYDREYVANEMAAFLLAWLCQLDCPMVDRPTPLSLAGCGRWPMEWASLAKEVGVCANALWQGKQVDITVLDGRAVEGGARNTALGRAAEEIARAARRSLVTLHFADGQDEPTLVGAAVRPAAGDPAVADALASWLDSR